jgi:hypothetical protein
MPELGDVVVRWSESGKLHEVANPGIIGDGRHWVYDLQKNGRVRHLNNLVVAVRTASVKAKDIAIPDVEIPVTSPR